MGREEIKFEADFRFVCERMGEFFEREQVRRALDLIEDVGITGWEKWWQVEFAAWLSEHDSIGEWVMEEVFLTDLRRRTEKDRIAIDIGFRMKGFSKDELLFLELKQNEDWRRCVENMLIDVEKVYCAQTYSLDNKLRIRNFFVVGVYPTEDAPVDEIHAYIAKRTVAMNIPLEPQHVFTKPIKGTPFSVTVF